MLDFFPVSLVFLGTKPNFVVSHRDFVDGEPSDCREASVGVFSCLLFVSSCLLVKYVNKSDCMQYAETFFSQVQEECFGKGEIGETLDGFQELLGLLDVLGVVYV